MKKHNKFILILLATFLFCLSCAHDSQSEVSASLEQTSVFLDKGEFKKVKFISRHFGEKDWQGTLAMNIDYAPIKEVRRRVESSIYLGNPLKFLTAWEAEGEAHITTITPIEYQECMWSEKRGIEVLHMKDIEKIALENSIQSSEIKIEGLGFGKKKFGDRHQLDETHFVIVSSGNLLEIRVEVYEQYLKKGGKKDCWSPNVFYPHITVGYTHKDIHFPDVEKNLKKSADPRFKLELIDSNTSY